jgi:hypothetical protein
MNDVAYIGLMGINGDVWIRVDQIIAVSDEGMRREVVLPDGRSVLVTDEVKDIMMRIRSALDRGPQV